MRQITEKIVADIDSSLSIHDFRIVKGSTHKPYIRRFHAVSLQAQQEDVQERITERIGEIDKNLHVVLTIDRSFVSTRNQKTIK